VIQANAYSTVVPTVVLAEVTSNLTLANDPACLVCDSVVSCLALVHVYADDATHVLGSLSPALMQRLDACLKAALGLP